jgi:radical SAM superfamily enzyme YgiQ (UPF0313 family)
MKVLFANFFNDEAYGMRILHSIVSERYDCKILFIKENNEQLITKVISNYSPDVLCVSLTSPNFCLYKKLYEGIRKSMNGGLIVLGGWHPTLNPNSCAPYCDVVVQGEAEKNILKILDDIERKSFLNLYTFSSLSKDINHPLFVFNGNNCITIEKGQILFGEPYSRNERYGTMMGRGCPYSCTYCSNSFMKEKYNNWTKIRYRNFEKVLEELLVVRKLFPNIKKINFYDEVFFQTEQYDSFLRQYKQEIGLPFFCMFYPGTVSEPMVEKLKEAGMVGVWLGVQSGSERVRRHVFERRYSNEKLMKQILMFKKHDVDVRYDFIFSNPFETKEEYQETIQLIKTFPKPFSINMFELKWFPNTKITKMALESGYSITTEDEIFYENPSYLIDEEKQKEILQEIG